MIHVRILFDFLIDIINDYILIFMSLITDINFIFVAFFCFILVAALFHKKRRRRISGIKRKDNSNDTSTNNFDIVNNTNK